ncbi:NmrA family protein [Nitzschia inconspicua]|uniref:NmrA family protein n=1 Tax=Nitzschia inconspicua TaxID=303405 RepID=A0A9K3PKV1_9STRA|nr:NmrA family protein [Nitzschia inconspicua]
MLEVGSCRVRRNRPLTPTTSTMAILFLVAALGSFMSVTEAFSQSLSASATAKPSSPEKRVAIIAGATGYIGRSVVQESVRQGYHTVALVRDIQKVQSSDTFKKFFEGAEVIECDVSDPNQILETFQTVQQTSGRIDGIVSCLASRSGIKKEAYAIDYQATLNCLEAGIACNAGHFVLLSAICVRKPLLQFQHAKLKFEAALQSQTSIGWTSCRPTAYTKSLSGQLGRLQEGKPFLIFQDSTRANPIDESELATYLVDCITEPSRRNRIINLGGPDRPLTKIEQGEMLFRAIGKEPKYSRLPIWIFDVSIDLLQWLADIFRSEPLENAAELGRIGKYYAVEDMVETENQYGTITLQDYFNRIAVEGQEFDPYTSMTGILGLLKNKNDKQQNVPVEIPALQQPQLSLIQNSTLANVGSSRSATEGVY